MGSTGGTKAVLRGAAPVGFALRHRDELQLRVDEWLVYCIFGCY